MPWQQLVWNVGLEVLDDADSPRGWSWAYRVVLVTVQRQAGKTTGVGPVHLHRGLTMRLPTYLTAQKRSDARDTWKLVADRLRTSPLAELATIRESNGDEGIFWSGGGSFRVFAPQPDALHGKANALVTVDESWAFDMAQGVDLEQAILPTFSTTGGQLWLPSTAGHGGSLWLRSYVDRGRAAVEAGRRDGIAYFEWSLPDEVAAQVAALMDGGTDADLDAALDLVLAHHPASGYTLDRGALRQAAETMTPDQFLRAYGNVWTQATDRVIPEHVWNARRRDDWPRPVGPVALAFDVAMDRSGAAIAAAWRDTDTGPLRIDVIEAHPGDGWVATRVAELTRSWQLAGPPAHNGGPALDVADELARLGIETRSLNAPQYATGCATILSAATNGRLAHAGRPALDDAVAVAATRPLGDAWAWSRRDSSASIAPLVAVTVAGWAFDHRPPAPQRPVIAVAGRRTRAAA